MLCLWYDFEALQERDEAQHQLQALRKATRTRQVLELQADNRHLFAETQWLQSSVEALQQRCAMMHDTYSAQVEQLQQRVHTLAVAQARCLCRKDCDVAAACMSMPAEHGEETRQRAPDGGAVGAGADARSMLDSTEAVGRAAQQLLQHCHNALQGKRDPAAAAQQLVSRAKAIQILCMLTAQNIRCAFIWTRLVGRMHSDAASSLGRMALFAHSNCHHPQHGAIIVCKASVRCSTCSLGLRSLQDAYGACGHAHRGWPKLARQLAAWRYSHAAPAMHPDQSL